MTTTVRAGMRPADPTKTRLEGLSAARNGLMTTTTRPAIRAAVTSVREA
ncbi:hypothetical protein C8E87_0861 [Paractinoplanes brasiliensis]|uniref:Uncharacterized protein n=1 Tax=Paractinoplanes brasiliensis TaxID=52695 RepID=A0A4R6JPF2_9ACTN|nr:hypothetical protein C8E87_0861 [Actinoplanes brasiliensis]